MVPGVQGRQSGDLLTSLPTGPCLSSWIAWLAQTVLSVQQPRAGWCEHCPLGMWHASSNPCSCCCSSPKPRGPPSSASSRRTQPVSSLTVAARVGAEGKASTTLLRMHTAHTSNCTLEADGDGDILSATGTSTLN